MSEKFCLKWNDFKENVNATFENLRRNKEFCDVTLACEDGRQVEAHKVVLAATSPVFQKLLSDNKHAQPMIYMRGVLLEDLEAIVDFLYFGEANIHEERLSSFLAIGEDMQLKGLTEGTKNPSEKRTISEPPIKKNLETNQLQTKPIEYEIYKPELNEFDLALQTYYPEETDLVENQTYLSRLNEQIYSLLKITEKDTHNNQGKVYVCTVCGKEGKLQNTKDHVELHHIEDVSIPCNFCDLVFKTRNTLRMHKAKHHRNAASN